MKLLAYFETSQEADTLALLLNSHGIVTHTSSQASKALGGVSYGVVRVGMWAVLDHQHEDAMALIENPNHIVTTGLSPEEKSDFEEQAGDQVFSSLNKAILIGMGLIVVMAWMMFKIASAG